MYELYFAVVMLAPAAMLIVGLMWKISPPPYRSKGLAYRCLGGGPPPLRQTVDPHWIHQRSGQRLFDGPVQRELHILLDVAHCGPDGAVLRVGVYD